MPNSHSWIAAVFKCNSLVAKKTLVELYGFIDDLKGVRSLHFLMRDRVDDEVIFSFRVMVEQKFKEMIKSKLSHKLSTLLTADKFSVDPPAENNFAHHVALSPEKRLMHSGQTKFIQRALKNMSSIVVDLIENDYIASS